MGAVYLAEHVKLRKKCAIKLLPREKGFDADWLRRFEREMQAVASLEHPNIVTATDAGEVDGWHYLVMEYLDGLDLSALARRCGPIPIDAAAAIGRDICNALEVVHQAGLVHRDVKPSNVMLTRSGAIKLLDLGLVLDDRALADEMRLTTVGHVMGTLAFAAPEQLSDEQLVDARADLYGLGATLFQLIAGRPAHTSSRGIAPLVIEKTSKPAPRLSSGRPDVPEPIDRLVARLLDRDPDSRPTGALEVAAELEPFAAPSLKSLAKEAIRITDDRSSSQEPYGIGAIKTRNDRSPPKKRNWIAASLFGLAALIAGFLFYVKTDRGLLIIESEVDGMTVTIKQENESVDAIQLVQGENRTSLRSGNYSIGFDVESDNVTVSDSEVVVKRGEETIVTVRKEAVDEIANVGAEEEIFKGKSLANWIQITKVERSLSTLKDAMFGIANLADEDDVEAAHTILIATRRLGGWAFDGGGGFGSNDDETEVPSQRFMSFFHKAFRRMMPMPAIPAITRELKEGNAKSHAACLLTLQTSYYMPGGRRLHTWIVEDKNRPTVVELHDAMRRLLRDGIEELPELQNQKLSHDACRKLSLQFALALDKPLAEEPGLESLLNEKLQAYTKSGTGLSQQERFKQIMVATEPWTDTWKQNKVSADELTAAKQFGIKYPLRVVVEVLLSGQQPNIHSVESLLNDSAGADELLAWMGSNMTQAFRKITYEPSWPTRLESIAKRTTRPDIAVRILERLCNTEKTVFGGESVSSGGGGFGVHRFNGTPSLKIQEAAKKSVRIAEERLFDDLESIDSLPKCVGDDVRRQAKKRFDSREGKPIPVNKRLDSLPSLSSRGGLSGGGFSLSGGSSLSLAGKRSVDWNDDGFVSEAEYAWSLQKRAWRMKLIPGIKQKQQGGFGGGGFGGGGQF